MGRYKLGPQGAYYDPNDSGPDQVSADQIAALQPPPGSGMPGIRAGEPAPGMMQPGPIEKFPGYQRPQFQVDRGMGRTIDPGMGHIIDTGARPPEDWWKRTIDWNDPASVWGGWTRNGQPIDPNNPNGGLFGPSMGGTMGSFSTRQMPSTPSGGAISRPGMGGSTLTRLGSRNGPYF